MQPTSRPASRLKVWLQLLRAPNLFTVPGDPVAGFLISNAGFSDASILAVASASLLFYGAGLLMNDVVDLDEDSRDRPNRPLPAGLARLTAVKSTTWVLNLAGLSLLFFFANRNSLLAGVGVVGAVWCYNHLTKKIRVLGALNMGLCRSLSVMTGALAGPAPYAAMIAAIFAITIGLFIAAITHLARFETRPPAPLSSLLLPILPLATGCLFGIRNSLFAPDKIPAAFLFALPLIGAALLLGKLLRRPQPPIPPMIGAHIRLLLPLQAAVCWFGASQETGPAIAIALLAFWPASRAVSKRFYAS